MLLKNFQVYKEPESPFRVSKTQRKNPTVEFRVKGKIRLEKSFIISLSVCIILFLIFPTYTVPPINTNPGSSVMVYTDVIPQTTQSGRRRPRPPDRPAVPIEAEVEEMAEDVTIDFDEISFSDLPPIPGNVRGIPDVTIGPRMIKQVLPSISDKDKKKGVKGSIDLSVEVDPNGKVIDVIVLKTTINNPDVIKSVVEAAYKSFYIPAKRGLKNVKDRTFIKYDVDFSR